MSVDKKIYAAAIIELRPGAEWSYVGGELIWQDESQTRPTDDEINTKYNELKNGQPAKLVREIRDQLLAESDWTQTRDNIRLNDSTWVTYRQELRDITKSASFNPKLNADGSLDESSVTWPLKPAS